MRINYKRTLSNCEILIESIECIALYNISRDETIRISDTYIGGKTRYGKTCIDGSLYMLSKIVHGPRKFHLQEYFSKRKHIIPISRKGK